MCVEYVFGGLCVLSMCLVCVVSVWWFVCVEYVFGGLCVLSMCLVVCVC